MYAQGKWKSQTVLIMELSNDSCAELLYIRLNSNDLDALLQTY